MGQKMPRGEKEVKGDSLWGQEGKAIKSAYFDPSPTHAHGETARWVIVSGNDMIHHLKRFKKTLTSLAAWTLTLGKKHEHGAFGQTFLNDRIVHVRPTQLIGLYRISRIFLFRNRSRAADTNTGQRVPICSHIVEQVIPRSHDLPVHL